MISYLFYLQSSRSEVFSQQLRLLAAREDLSTSEAIVVWHGEFGNVDLDAFPFRTICSIESKVYNKAILVNRAVQEAHGAILAILDADRVMPSEYFTRSAAQLRPGTAIAPSRLIKALIPVTDEEIWEMRFPYKRDDRPERLIHFRKHLFSGNTILFKEDYLSAGGMDENYRGYGFNDLDFSRTWERKGFGVQWSEAEEIHLYHERLDDKNPDEFYAQNSFNAYRFSKKWNEPLPEKFCYDLQLIPVL